MKLFNRHTRLPKILKDFTSVFCGIFLARLFNFLSGILIARVAGAEAIGDYTLFMTIFVILSEATEAIDTTLIKFCSNHSKNEKEFIKYAFIAKFIYTIFFATIIYGFKLLFLTESNGYWKLVFCAGLSGCMMSFFMIEIAWEQYNSNYFKVSIMKFLCQFFCLGFIAAGLLFGLYNNNYMISTYLMVGGFLSLVAIWLHLDAIKSKTNINFLKKFISTASILITAAIVNIISGRLDIFFISGFLDKIEVGYYGAALRATSIMTLFAAVTSVLLVPNAPGAATNLNKRKKYLLKTMTILSVQSVLLLAVAAFANEIVFFLYGEGFTNSVLPLRILVFQILIASAVIPFQALIQVGPSPEEVFKTNIKQLFVGVICCFLLIPTFGLAGAAVVGIITNIFLLFSFLSIQKKIDTALLNNG